MRKYKFIKNENWQCKDFEEFYKELKEEASKLNIHVNYMFTQLDGEDAVYFFFIRDKQQVFCYTFLDEIAHSIIQNKEADDIKKLCRFANDSLNFK